MYNKQNLKFDKNFFKELPIVKFFTFRTCEEKLIKFDLLRSLFFHVIPILFTIGVTYYTITNNLFSKSWIPIIKVVCVIVVIMNIYNCWNETIKKDFIEALYNYKEVENKNIKLVQLSNNISNEIFRNTTWSILLLKLYSTIIDFINSKNSQDIEMLLSLLKDKIINTLYDYLSSTLNIGEHITLALYLFDEQNNVLIDYVSKKSNVMPKGEHGRTWSINSESQIAHTFRSGKYHVFYDIQKFLPGLSSDEKQELDELFYRASITYPLRYYDDNNTIRGVFCITSNRPGAFSTDESDIDVNTNFDINKLLIIRQNIIFTICALIETLLNRTCPASNNSLIEQITNKTYKN